LKKTGKKFVFDVIRRRAFAAGREGLGHNSGQGEHERKKDAGSTWSKSYDQGCQIYIGTPYQNGEKYTKWQHNMYTK
jgi:hypothetical protein